MKHQNFAINFLLFRYKKVRKNQDLATFPVTKQNITYNSINKIFKHACP